MKHPQLCPKTEVDFYGVAHTGAVDALISDNTYLDDDYPDHRQFIARFQACAWQDRADRWINVFHRAQKKRWPHFFGLSVYLDARANARAWREWEKK
jgi:hypothetical protein